MIILMWNYWVGLAHVVLMCFDVVCDPPLILFCLFFVFLSSCLCLTGASSENNPEERLPERVSFKKHGLFL